MSKKTDLIREMLLKTVGKSPDLFCYYVAIQEAKELLKQQDFNTCENYMTKSLKILAEI
ncbi:MAG: hypothetical protein HYY52_01310 [Candidatus Melainabacteria bacterium]|nr:hypothetical protein [Candidatus Melainabacteria bacterium]